MHSRANHNDEKTLILLSRLHTEPDDNTKNHYQTTLLAASTVPE